MTTIACNTCTYYPTIHTTGQPTEGYWPTVNQRTIGDILRAPAWTTPVHRHQHQRHHTRAREPKTRTLPYKIWTIILSVRLTSSVLRPSQRTPRSFTSSRIRRLYSFFKATFFTEGKHELPAAQRGERGGSVNKVSIQTCEHTMVWTKPKKEICCKPLFWLFFSTICPISGGPTLTFPRFWLRWSKNRFSRRCRLGLHGPNLVHGELTGAWKSF